MFKRKIIEIDRNLCDGCGLCTEACAEGALELDDENKAVLVREIYCDGLGACLDVCPTGALKIVDRETRDYDPMATYEHVKKVRGAEAAAKVHGLGELKPEVIKNQREVIPSSRKPLATACPGSLAREISKVSPPGNKEKERPSSELSQWPIQLHLVSPYAPYFKECELLIAADCTAFALGSFHSDLLRGKRLIIACPKLDDTSDYIEKLAEIFRNNNICSLTVAVMVVPCCSGLIHLVEKAVDLAGVNINPKKIVIDVEGKILADSSSSLKNSGGLAS